MFLGSQIQAAKIAALSSGKFVGIVAESPDQKMSLMMFIGRFDIKLSEFNRNLKNSFYISLHKVKHNKIEPT